MPGLAVDPYLEQVARWWRNQARADERIGDNIRRAFDEVLDGQRTGRFRYEELSPTEKVYIGSKLEVLLRDEFELRQRSDRKRLDFNIDGVEVDCKFSLRDNWMIPPEAFDELCLIVTASEESATFSFGLLRCHEWLLSQPNRDQKRGILARGKQRINWLWTEASMPENLLRNLPESTRDSIFGVVGKRKGQARINELFRQVQGRIVRREVTLTVARQDDGMKRARDARKHLQKEGILVLGHQEQHPRICKDLEISVPRKGEHIAVRVVSAKPSTPQERTTLINGSRWLMAAPGDPRQPGPWPYTKKITVSVE